MNIRAMPGNLLIAMDIKNKEIYNLTDDIQIELSVGFNFNRRIDAPSIGVLIDGGEMPKGCFVMLHHNCSQSGHDIEGYDLLTPEQVKKGFKAYNLPLDMCYFYFDKGDWQPCQDIVRTLRLYTPYVAPLGGLVLPEMLAKPQLIEDRLLVINGIDDWEDCKVDISRNVFIVTKYADYEMLYHNEKNKEASVIRTRTRELVAIDGELTEKVLSGEILVGVSDTDCKPFIDTVKTKPKTTPRYLVIDKSILK